MNKLLIITTGGTIDKIYFDDMSDYQIGEPQIGEDLVRALVDEVDMPEVAELWRRDSVIGSWLLDLTAAALVSENKVLAHPASVDSIPTPSSGIPALWVKT